MEAIKGEYVIINTNRKGYGNKHQVYEFRGEKVFYLYGTIRSVNGEKRVCTKCNEFLPITDFALSGVGTYLNICKTCRTKQIKKYPAKRCSARRSARGRLGQFLRKGHGIKFKSHIKLDFSKKLLELEDLLIDYDEIITQESRK